RKKRMFGDVDIAVQVAARTAVVSRLSLAPQAKLHAVVDAGRHFHLDADRSVFASRSRALRAFVADDFSCAAASRARGLNAEEPLRLNDLPAPGAVAAPFR